MSSNPPLSQKPHESERSAPFVPVVERVVLNDEIEQMWGLFLKGGVLVRAENRLENVSDESGEASGLFFFPEQVGGFLFFDKIRLSSRSACTSSSAVNSTCFLLAPVVGNVDLS